MLCLSQRIMNLTVSQYWTTLAALQRLVKLCFVIITAASWFEMKDSVTSIDFCNLSMLCELRLTPITTKDAWIDHLTCTSFVPNLLMVFSTWSELFCVSSTFILFSSLSPSVKTRQQELDKKWHLLTVQNNIFKKANNHPPSPEILTRTTSISLSNGTCHFGLAISFSIMRFWVGFDRGWQMSLRHGQGKPPLIQF